MARLIATALVVLAISVISVSASDPELTTDFFVPDGINFSAIDGSYFTFNEIQNGVNPTPGPGQFGVSKVFSDQFTALTGLGLASALLQFGPNGLNPPHTHPRGSEMLLVLSGTLNVGVIDTTNKLYVSNITAGDVFVFPKGLVHYQLNLDANNNATAYASFSTSSPGVVSLPANVFGSSIPVDILAEAFSVSADIIGQLEAPFGGV